LAVTHSGIGRRCSWRFRLVWVGGIIGLLVIFAAIVLSKAHIIYLPDFFDAGIVILITNFWGLPIFYIGHTAWKIYRGKNVTQSSQRCSGSVTMYPREILVNLGCSLALLSLGNYSVFVEPNMLRVENIEIVSDKVSEEVTILHLTDMHVTKIGSYEHKIFRRIRELNPDMIVRTGDFLDVHDSTEKRQILQELAAMFRQCAPKYGMYAVLGNHDWHLRGAPIKWFDQLSGNKTLVNEEHLLTTEAGHFRLAGLSIHGSRTITKTDLEAWWKDIEDHHFTILLGHYPDYILKLLHMDIDLCLAGHLHGGGQVRLPFIGAIPFLYEAVMRFCHSDVPRTWAAGYHEVGNTRINVGVGTGGTPVRFNCPPTMTLFTITPL
jgi:predicted MPP superfamily phosphohydrolase